MNQERSAVNIGKIILLGILFSFMSIKSHAQLYESHGSNHYTISSSDFLPAPAMPENFSTGAINTL